MDRSLKERVIGASVLVGLAVWLIPWVLDGPLPDAETGTVWTPSAERSAPVRTQTIRLEGQQAAPAPVTETDIPGGAGATSSSCVTISGAKAPNPSPTTRSPMETVETSEPVPTTCPHSSRPRSPSSMKPRERNTSQKLSPAASTATRTSFGSRVRGGSGFISGLSNTPLLFGASTQCESSGRANRSPSASGRTRRAAFRLPER